MSDEEEVTDQENTHTESVFSPTAQENNESQSTVLSTSTSTYSNKPFSSKKRKRKTDPRDDLLITIIERLYRPNVDEHEKDRFSVYGDNVAMKLRALPKDQRIMAEKLINDVLFEAECNTLNRGWRLQPPLPAASSSNHTFTANNNTEVGQPQYVTSYPNDNNN